MRRGSDGAHNADMADVRQIAECVGEPEGTVAQWDSLGLLAEPAVERARLIGFAARRGVSAAEIAELLDRGQDVIGSFVEFVQAECGSRPFGALAELSELDPGLVRRLWIAAGLSDQRDVYDEDVELFGGLAAALRLGLPEDALLQLVRVFGDAMGRVAEAQIRLFHLQVHSRMRAEGLSGVRLLETARAVSDPLTELGDAALAYFHRKAMQRALREDMIMHLTEDLAAEETEVGQVSVAVLFADLAGFTPMTEAMGDRVAAAVVERFSDVVREATGEAGGRIIKQIGDEFMLAFGTAAAAVSCGLGLAERLAEEPNFPALRMGAHVGSALYREGDYLGTTVNIAARVAGHATRGQFLVTEAMRDQLPGDGQDVKFEPVGGRRLKGIQGEVPLFDLRAGTARPGRAVDPVCRMEVDPTRAAAELSWREDRVYFCSDDCLRQFVATPGRFV
ncbi:hypothetical protein GCM10023321_55870 [Pseudonocardia eucalypti]|uniref:YHS domain-containing protein n=2 Tax=Pseudonocardia eucalypti TaxID=648755 RepID=A0ABP9QQJ1_9PSEU